MKRTIFLSAGAMVVALVAAAPIMHVSAAVEQEPAAGVQGEVPQFDFGDPTWPKPLPNVIKVEQVVGISVDSRNHIWIVQRPGSLKNSESEAADGRYGSFTGAISGCCRPAAPVIEFDQEGNMVRMWGGPQEGLDWPTPGPKKS